jgi:hypothetical protein
LFHQFAQRDRSAAGLQIQPIPMTGQKRDLFWDHAQPRPPAPVRLDTLSVGNLIWFSADIKGEVDLPARCIVENQDRALRPVAQKSGNLLGAAAKDFPKTFECRVPHHINIPG